MSHTVKIRTEIKDEAAVAAACRRLVLPAPISGKTRLFSAVVEGLAVQLPNWRYPVVFNLKTGEAQHDNYGGQWGEQRELNRFLQGYTVEKTKIEAGKKGYSVYEQTQADGSIKLTVQVAA